MQTAPFVIFVIADPVSRVNRTALVAAFAAAVVASYQVSMFVWHPSPSPRAWTPIAVGWVLAAMWAVLNIASYALGGYGAPYMKGFAGLTLWAALTIDAILLLAGQRQPRSSQ